MTLGDGVLLLIRWFHALAAATWVGGSLFYVLVLRPRARAARAQEAALGPEAISQFRGLVDTCIAVLIVTGTVMLFDRLTSAFTPTAYVVTAAIKIALALVMFAVARRRWRQRRSQAASSPMPRQGLITRAMGLMSGVNLIVILGIIVFFLSDLLAFIYQEGLTGR